MTMVKTTQGINFFLFVFLLLSQSIWSQNEAKKENVVPEQTQGPICTVSETLHDFGRINEADGYATHVFKVKNTGSAPLIISHVQSSCGCTEPEWTTSPIDPGKEGHVTVTYDSRNRPGPFKKNITAYTNEKKLRQLFTITGDVVPKSSRLQLAFHDTIGTVQMERKDFMFYTIRPREIVSQEIWIQNFAKEGVTLHIDKVPDFLSVTVPERLESEKPERLGVQIDATKIDMKGRLLSHFTWKAVNASGTLATYNIPVSINFIDDFTTLTPSERADGPAVNFSTMSLEYGKLKTSGFLGLGNKRVYQELIISNTGKSPLTFHSITVDDPRAQITGFNKRILQPEETLTLRIFINPKDIKGFFATALYVVCNDPRGPVRQVSIAAER